MGPAGPAMTHPSVVDALHCAPRAFLRTRRHPASTQFADIESFDFLYEKAETFEELYVSIVESLVGAAREAGHVVFAVPGSPLVAERSVELLRSDHRVDVTVEPALSFLDLAWDRLAIDPISSGVRILDASSFPVDAAQDRGPLLVGQCWSEEILSAVKLSAEPASGTRVTVLSRLGLPDERIYEVSWENLDRDVEPDHLTTLFIPVLNPPIGIELARLGELARVLREQCPWDRIQTHQSLQPHLLEEAYEVLDAINELGERDNAVDHLEEELGDLLFQVQFHAVLAAEEGLFTMADVAEHVYHKLVRRHPHVFSDVSAPRPEDVSVNWERIKEEERNGASVMEGIPRSLPALSYAAKILRRSASIGYQEVLVPDRGKAQTVLNSVADVLAAELDDPNQLTASDQSIDNTKATALTLDEPNESPTDTRMNAHIIDHAPDRASITLGSLLLAITALAVGAGVDPELALRAAAGDLRRRAEAAERNASGPRRTRSQGASPQKGTALETTQDSG